MTTIRDELPLFPLRLVLFPSAPLPLHIFEPRYRQMVTDVLASDRRFGVILAHPEIDNTENVSATEPTSLKIAQIGTIAEIVDVTPYPDGRYDIMCTGRDRFAVLQTDTSRPYLRASVRLFPESSAWATADATENVVALINEVQRALTHVLQRHIDASDSTDTRRRYLDRVIGALPSQPGSLAFLASRLLPTASIRERQALLSEDGTERRLRLVKAHLDREARIADQLGQLKSDPASDTDERLISLN